MTTADLPALGAATLCEAFQLTAQHYADAPALRTPGDAQRLTYGEWAAKVERVAGGLAELGLRRGDTLALMTTNRPEFFIADMAAEHLGALGDGVGHRFDVAVGGVIEDEYFGHGGLRWGDDAS